VPKTAVVIYNLGGPDGPGAVQPFLFNLFNDPMILRMPGPMRWLLAKLISARRAPVAREIYRQMGGRSPILEQTAAQRKALQRALGADGETRVFVAMRYWHPFARECAADVAAFDPEKIVLLPLYPQFSTTTTGSFLRVWDQAAAAVGLRAPTSAICCYPTESGFVDDMAGMTREAIARASAHGTPRVLFSAHGLPKKIVAAGDPYQAQVEMTVDALRARLAGTAFDSVVCYQSRVGPVEWLKPYTDAEVRAAAAAGRPIVVVPVAFVSEHSETLVELDIEYRELALAGGAPCYERVPTVGTGAGYIAGLARLAQDARAGDAAMTPDGGTRLCPAGFGDCPCGNE